MKYMATREALDRARLTNRIAISTRARGEKITPTSMIVRARSHQKMAM
jgi:hypothetical protein